jgi:hypothetical protein
MSNKIVRFEFAGRLIELEIGPATVEMGMRRSMLLSQARGDAEPQADDDPTLALARHLLRTIYYPTMIAAVVRQSGFDHWPISYEEYAALPEPPVIEWEEATFALNPHWKPRPEKKVD